MLNLNSIMFGSENPQALADFYEKVFDMKPVHSGGGWTTFKVGSCSFSVGSHDKVKGKSTNPERIMFNLETTEVEKEFARIKALGATVIAEPYAFEEGGEKAIATFADPEGNYFQLVIPWED